MASLSIAPLKPPPEGEPLGCSPSSTMDTLRPPKPAGATACAASAHHAIRIAPDGAVLVSGSSALHEEGEVFVAHLGLGEVWGAPVASPTPLNVPILRATAAAAGSLHSLLLDRDGAVWSCGAGWEGPLGHGDEATVPVPRRISSLAVAVQSIAAGAAHSLAVCSGGQVHAWGWGRHGQLGHGGRSSVLSPRRVEAVSPPTRAIQAAAGCAHSLLLCSDGSVLQCGRAAACAAAGAKQDEDEDEDEGEDERLARDVLTPRRVEVAPLRVVRLSASGDGSSAEGEGGRCFRWGVWREGEAGARGGR